MRASQIVNIGILLAICATAEGASTAPANLRPEIDESPMLFLERSTFALGFPYGYLRIPRLLVPEEKGGTPLVFEAQPTLHISLWNRFSRLTALKPEDEGHRRFRGKPLVLSLTFNPLVRMLALDSNPVRSPSWRIRANAQYFFLHRNPDQIHKVQLTGLRLSLGHHSNGQERCPFSADTVRGDPCPLLDDNNPDLSKVNRVDGDFSLNHITGAVHHRWVTTRPLKEGTTLMLERQSHTVGAVVDNFVSFFPGGQRPDQARLHGNWRGRAEYTFEVTLPPLQTFIDLVDANTAGRIQLLGYGEYTLGGHSAVTPWRVGTEASYTFDALGGFGFFVNASAGRDYYNLLFVDKTQQILMGVVLDFYRRPRYACPELDEKCR